MATVTKSIGTASRDYSTISAWEADLDNGAVYSASDLAVGECYNDSVFNEVFTIDGGGTIGLGSVELTVAESQRHDGTAGTGARIETSINTQNFVVIINLASSINVYVNWLEIKATGTTSTLIGALNENTNTDNLHTKLIVHGFDSSASLSVGVLYDNEKIRFSNCVVYDCYLTHTSRNYVGIYTVGGAIKPGRIINCTVYKILASGPTSQGIGISNSASSTAAVIKNNVSCGCDLDFEFISTPGENTNNASSDTTSSGGGATNYITNIVTANQFVSITGGSEDLHIKSGSDLIGAGVDLGTTDSANIDIDGYDRDAAGVTWDIGADQYVALAAVLRAALLMFMLEN